jgi:hypothetical protein
MSQQAFAIVFGVFAELLTAAMMVVCTKLLLRLLCSIDAKDEEGGADGWGPGGGDNGPPDGPPDGGDADEPAWWPQFEHEFAAHVLRRSTARRPCKASDRG